MGPCVLRAVAASGRAGEHAPGGRPLLPKPAHRPSAGDLRCVRARTAWCKAAVWLGHGGRCRYTGGMSRVIAANEYRRARWRNGLGLTRATHAHRPDPGDDWTRPLSIAQIARDGTFSAFPCVARGLVVLHAKGLALRFGDGGAP